MLSIDSTSEKTLSFKTSEKTLSIDSTNVLVAHY